MDLLHWITGLIWPTRCLGCAVFDTPLCQACANGLTRAPWQPGQHYWGAVRMDDDLASSAVWHLKYRGMRSLAGPMAYLMATRFAKNGNRAWFNDGPLLVPVPLHPRRLAERGYNQAELLAHELGKLTAMEVAPDALKRVRRTESQVSTSSRHERLENMHGAFSANLSERIRGRSVILIDDVSTTGATLDDCTRALKEAGATTVTGLVFARG